MLASYLRKADADKDNLKSSEGLGRGWATCATEVDTFREENETISFITVPNRKRRGFIKGAIITAGVAAVSDQGEPILPRVYMSICIQ